MEVKYKIAFLMHGARNVGGGENALYQLIKHLDRDIFEPIVFYSHDNEIVKRLRKDGTRLVQVNLSEKITSVYRDEIKRDAVTLFVYAKYLIDGIFRVAKLLKKYEIDILHPHDNLSKIIGGFAAKIGRSKVITHCHDLLTRSFIDRFLKYYQLVIMDRIISVSYSARGAFSMFGKIPDKVHAIHNGIDLKQFDYAMQSSAKEELGIGDKRFVIGIIAVFDRCKGHIFLFEAIKMLIENSKTDVVCLVIGDGRIGDELREFVQHEKLDNYIKFLGYRTDIAELLSIIDIVVIPSLQESFGITALEAMAMKVPVIATRVGGLPEIVIDGETGMIVPTADTDSLYKAISFLMNNDAIRNKMGESGRRRVQEKFDLAHNVEKIEEIYLNVFKKR